MNTQLTVKQAATKLLEDSKISTSSRVILLGSNYLMFRKLKPNPDAHCPKCADSFELAQPKPVDIFTFEVSLKVREMLIQQGVPASVLIMPSDFLKGATSGQLKAFRESYELPVSFRELLETYKVPESERIFMLESSFKARAQRILRKRILGDESVPYAFRKDNSNQAILAFPGHALEFPIGSTITKGDLNVPVPFCQMICSAFYERIGKMGFTDFIGLFNDNEQACINQGTALASILGFLKMNARLSIFAQMREGGLELLDIADYGPDELAYPYSELRR